MTELIKARGENLSSEIHELVNSIWNMEELFTRRVMKLTVVIIEAYRCNKFNEKIIHNIHLSRLTPYIAKLLEIIDVNLDTTNQLHIIFIAFVRPNKVNSSLCTET
jgi:hypothetical protein